MYLDTTIKTPVPIRVNSLIHGIMKLYLVSTNSRSLL